MVNWEIVCDDVIKWAAEYDGPKFHALIADPPYAMSNKKKIALEALANLPENATNADIIAAYHALQQQGDVGFMGRDWDDDVAFNPDTWAALAEHLLPGAFGMAFASSRGWHRLAVAIEDAGLRIHPSIFGWSYGSGFPKATRIDTQVDKAAGAERESCGFSPRTKGRLSAIHQESQSLGSSWTGRQSIAATPLAAAWEGHRYGLQAMKPALEPIIVFQKPYVGKPVKSITETGAGALNIDGARIGTSGTDIEAQRAKQHKATMGDNRFGGVYADNGKRQYEVNTQGRWPANFVLQHTPECVRTGTRRVRGSQGIRGSDDGNKMYGGGKGLNRPTTGQRVGYTDIHGLETVSAWDCPPECPVRRLGEQSGERPTGRFHQKGQSDGTVSASGWGSRGNRTERLYIGDTGTAARFFFQSSWEYEKMERQDPLMQLRSDLSEGEKEHVIAELVRIGALG